MLFVPEEHIPQMVDNIPRLNPAVPILDHHFVHVRDGVEVSNILASAAVGKLEDVVVGEMRV